MNYPQKFEIVELDEFAGYGARLYSLALGDDEATLYDTFLAEYNELFPDELKDIVSRLDAITRLGAWPHFFKENEGALGAGDGLVALFDLPGKQLRLYCIGGMVIGWLGSSFLTITMSSYLDQTIMG